MTLSPLFGVAVSLAFVSGVLVGVLFADTFRRALMGKGLTMSPEHRPPPRPISSTTTPRRRWRVPFWVVMRVLMFATLIANLIVGLLLIATREDVKVQARELDDLVKCVAEYNRDLGVVLDERQVATTRAARYERDLWRELGQTLRNPAATLEEITGAIDAYVAVLDEQAATRAGAPYPDPDRCRKMGK